MKKKLLFFCGIFVLLLAHTNLQGQDVNISIDINAGNKAVSPYIYGKNNTTSSKTDKPLTTAQWTQVRESGATILRENCGNESTKYNWERKLTSSPDWYNAVDACDWDFEAKSIKDNLPNVQAMYGFQLLGYAAKSKDYNWDAWSWYVAHNNTWLNAAQNLTGNGTPDPSSDGTALVEGDINLYLEKWPISSSVGILDHWFGTGGIGLDKDKFRYWAMDNEPDIWSSTHDDVMKTQINADEFMTRYFEAAKLARSKHSNIKIVGPITANEWFWYNWPGGGTTIDGKKVCWLEYFIKRVADEQKATGIRLLDVLAIHFYPGSTKTEDVVQMHRIYFDENYEFPEANGIFAVNGGWDTTIKKEYVFKRCNDWLNKYMGTGHNVKMGVTETGIKPADAKTNSVWYASTLGEFMKNDVELFTPWSWKLGMWETLHLFARYNEPTLVQSSSSDETNVSAYTTSNSTKDKLVVVLVNRSTSATKTVNLNPSNFTLNNESFQVLTLKDLPTTETFVSHTQNALKSTTVTKTNNTVKVTLAPMSITTVILKGKQGPVTVPVTGVTVSPTTASVAVGATTQLTATVSPSNATNKTVSWSSANTSVATVSSTGLVTGKAAGSAIITVTTQDGSKKATSTITVTGPLTTLFQAENYTSQSGSAVSSGNTGYTGTGYLDFGGNGSWMEWNNVKANTAGTVTLVLRYANGTTGNRQCDVKVNGTSIGNLTFASTGSWTTWNTQSISASMNSGNNTIRLTANTSSGGPNLDKMDISSLKSAEITFDETSNSSNTNLIIYPNPVKDQTTIDFPYELEDNSVLKVFDNTGRVMISANVRGLSYILDMSELDKGIYYIFIYNSGTILKDKVVKK